MKVTSIDIFIMNELGTMKNWKPVFCRINTDEGIYGYGESGVAYKNGPSAAFNMIKELAPLVIGMDPMNNEVIWEKMFKNTFWAQGGGSIVFAAISAIDIALMDIKGKALNVPVYKLMGGKYRDKIRCYASQIQFGWGDPNVTTHGIMKTDEEYVQAALSAVSQGYDAIKMDLLTYYENGEKIKIEDTTGFLTYDLLKLAEGRLSSVREAIGPKVDIIIENHGCTDANTSVQWARIAEKYGILYFEEPVTPLYPEITRRVASKIELPVAAGERIYTRWGYVSFFNNGSLSIIQPDIANCGGLSEAKKICDMAHTYDVSVQGHVCGGPISLAAALQLEAAIPNFFIHEHHVYSTYMFNRKLGKYDYQPVKGCFSVPELPGIGQELSEEAIAMAEKITVY